MNSSSVSSSSSIFFPCHLHFLHSHSFVAFPSSPVRTTPTSLLPHFGHFLILNVFPSVFFFLLIPFALAYSAGESYPSFIQSGVANFDFPIMQNLLILYPQQM